MSSVCDIAQLHFLLDHARIEKASENTCTGRGILLQRNVKMSLWATRMCCAILFAGIGNHSSPIRVLLTVVRSNQYLILYITNH